MEQLEGMSTRARICVTGSIVASPSERPEQYFLTVISLLPIDGAFLFLHNNDTFW